MHDLGTLGGISSNAKAINAIGQVTGFSNRAGGAPTYAFRYDPAPGGGGGGVMHDLGTLGGLQCIGHDVNNLGIVVGESELSAPLSRHAFIYTGTPGLDGQMIDLDAWLDVNNPTEGAKWTLNATHGITDTGWITGFGGYDPDGPGGDAGVGRAFLLDASTLVPEPETFSLLAVGAGMSLARLRRRR